MSVKLTRGRWNVSLVRLVAIVSALCVLLVSVPNLFVQAQQPTLNQVSNGLPSSPPQALPQLLPQPADVSPPQPSQQQPNQPSKQVSSPQVDEKGSPISQAGTPQNALPSPELKSQPPQKQQQQENNNPSTSGKTSALPSQQSNKNSNSNENSPASSRDPCAVGLCDIPSKGRCLSLGNTARCQAFSGHYLPSDLSKFFAAKFPAKVFSESKKLLKPAGNIPPINSPQDFDKIFGGTNLFAFFGNFSNSYSISLFGCTAPNQRYLTTYFCLDLIQFYQQENNPCSAGEPPKICRSTLTARAESLKGDIESNQFCLIPRASFALGNAHISLLNDHPLASDDSNCVSGESNEVSAITDTGVTAGFQRCGFGNDAAVCRSPGKCPTMSPALRAMCPQVLNDAIYAKPASLSDAFDSATSATAVVALIFLVILCGILASALYAMSRLRTVSTKKLRPDTMARYDPDAAPRISVAGFSTMSAAAAATTSADLSDSAKKVRVVSAATSGDFNPAPAPSQPGLEADEGLGERRVMAAFEAVQGDEMSVGKNEILNIVQIFADGWLLAENPKTGATGIVPGTIFQED